MNARCFAPLCVLTALAVGCAPPTTGAPRSDVGVVRSNVLRSDYAGSAACEPCHAEIYAKFMKSPMHRMTRHTDGAEVNAPFDGRAFHFKGDSVVLEEHEGRRYMRLETRKAT